MSDFFEERPEEVTDGILLRWEEKQHEIAQRKQQEDSYKAKCMLYKLDKIRLNQQRSVFNSLFDNLQTTEVAQVSKQNEDERERRIVAEASLSVMSYELKEALDKIAAFEKKELKRIEKKKRMIQQKRQNNVNLYIILCINKYYIDEFRCDEISCS